MTSCTECPSPAKARGWCLHHYHRWYRYGDPLHPIAPTKGSSIEDLLRWHGWGVKASGCWEFRGPRTSRGYGRIRVQGRNTMVHRLAYELWIGPILEGRVVRHKCDNPPCINPDHLLEGLQSDNVNDMIERNRNADFSGDKNPRAKLSWDEIREIRSRQGVSQSKLAEEFGVVQSVIGGIRSGKLWRETQRV